MPAMITITLRRIKLRLFTILIACLIVLGLCWGVPRFYDFLASGSENEEYMELDDPVRVETVPDAELRGTWLTVLGREAK